jgi:serine O-acetyltransferase
MLNALNAVDLLDPTPPAADPATAAATITPTPVSDLAIPDFSRERGIRWSDPGPRILASLRGYQRWRHRWGLVGRVIARFYALSHRFWSVVGAAEIPLNSNIAGGLRLNHPNGIVIHPCARIGPNCLILQQVTIGEGRTPGHPTIGADVLIGAGAKILGGVTIGDHARIGANAVVLCDVPPYATAVGIPARIIPKDPTPNLPKRAA